MKLMDEVKEVLGIRSPSKEFQKGCHEAICDTRDAGWTGLDSQNADWKGCDARDASKRDII